jgi:hypothetical protein
LTRKPWDPIQQYPVNPHYLKVIEDAGEDLSKKRIEVWGNSFYQITARIYLDGLVLDKIKEELGHAPGF